MPEYLRGEERNIATAVRVGSSNSTTYYAWKTKDLTAGAGVDTQDLAALGHVTLATLPGGSLYLLRAQSPKPGRAKKILDKNPTVSKKGSVSTFYGAGSLTTAINAGWNPTKRPKGVSLTANSRYTTAIAKLSDDSLYVFPMNTKDFANYKSSLGLLAPNEVRSESERRKLVRGSSIPRPGRASLKLEGGKEFSSFFSTDNYSALLDANFNVLFEEYVRAT